LCYLTDNVDGDSDVDNGVTRLTSPLLATVGPDEEVIVSYQRWYSNDAGSAPQADIFTVEISNNNGASWQTLETVGPTGAEAMGGWISKAFRISDVIAPTGQIRLRFTASDLAAASVVEAGVDAVAVKIVTCEDPTFVLARKMLDGVIASGQLVNTRTSDNNFLKINPTPTANPTKQKVDMLALGVSPVASPSALRLRLEGKKIGGPVGDVIQTMQLLNYQTNQFETIDMRATQNADTIVDVPVTGNVARFVQPGTLEMTARVIVQSPGFTGAPFTWSIDMDELVWIVD
jgi:hypothetical protein